MTEIVVKLDTGDLIPKLEELISLLKGTGSTVLIEPALAQPAPVQPAPVAPTPITPAPVTPAPAASAPITSAPRREYNIDQLATAASPLMDMGRGAELIALVTSLGVRALTDLPRERYGEFADGLRALGVQI